MSNENSHGFSGDERYGRSLSQGSIESNLASWLSGRFSPSTSANYFNSHDFRGEIDDDENDAEHALQRLHRTPSVSMRLRRAGGVNSIDNFARSWQRAAGFLEVVPRRPSFTFESEGAAIDDLRRDSLPKSTQPLLAGHFDRSRASSEAIDEGLSNQDAGAFRRDLPESALLSAYDASSYGRSFGTSYGTISSRRTLQLYHEHQAIGAEPQPGTETLLVKQVQHEDGTKENIIVGQSTVPQTIFNSVNVLIGVGLLSLPLGIKYAGWLVGLLFLCFSAGATAYTAKILAKCLDIDHSLVTYGDLAYVSFGHQARLITSLLFCLELLGACVALVVLFGDSLNALIPGFGLLQWKIICGVILIPLSFVPLRFLSVTSILGILSCTAIVTIVFIDGLIKPDPPGSLIQPAKTYIFPEDWYTVPLSFGLIMSPWGGHGVFPNIYRDMRHPRRYNESLWATYIFTFSLDFFMAVIGLLMFGDDVSDEITANILLTTSYPQALSICIIIFIAIIPITKVPLNSRPLVATLEVLCGLGSANPRHHQNESQASRTVTIAKVLIRLLVIVLIVFISIVFPSFDRIMALMGSCLCFTICIILPLTFYLKIFGKEIPLSERILDWFLLTISSVMACIGTVWAFLPQKSSPGL
ncbi:putative transporter [Talaromyces proteolyticus]|uniref:Transporter n=1 Tax=Talaromyces proteolyticus TaxID=1131652 RepID=A0AAD4L3P6_9EURO|nr:putative transporter [Talaromyces proteolyticus]KAH8702629.1 putative transporter [Talaromyces proteolyticus]